MPPFHKLFHKMRQKGTLSKPVYRPAYPGNKSIERCEENTQQPGTVILACVTGLRKLKHEDLKFKVAPSIVRLCLKSQPLQPHTNHPHDILMKHWPTKFTNKKNDTTTDWGWECLEHSEKKFLILEKGSERDQKSTVQLIKILFKLKCIWEKINLIMEYIITITKNYTTIHFKKLNSYSW